MSNDATQSGSPPQPPPAPPSSSDFQTAFRLQLLVDQFRRRFVTKPATLPTNTDVFAIQAHTNITRVESQMVEQQRVIAEQQRQLIDQQRIIQQLTNALQLKDDSSSNIEATKKRGFESMMKKEDSESHAASAAAAAASPSSAANALSSSPPIEPSQLDRSDKRQKCDDQADSMDVLNQARSSSDAIGLTADAITPQIALSSIASLIANASLISVSVQLVMQFLQLKEVGRAARVCRSWCSAAANPFIWLHRSDFIDCPKQRPASWSTLPVLKNVHTVRLSVYRDKSASLMLNQLRSRLPHLTTFHLESEDAAISRQVMRHSLWQRMKFVSLEYGQLRPQSPPDSPKETDSNDHESDDDAGEEQSQETKVKADHWLLTWRDVEQGVRVCKQLTKLHLRQNRYGEVRARQLAMLMNRLPHLQELSLTCDPYTTPLPAPPIAQMLQLHTLKVSLQLRFVEEMCELGGSALVSLRNLDLILIALNDESQEESENQRAALNFGLSANSNELLSRRLACLGRFIGLYHLTLTNQFLLQMPNPMLLLPFAQQRCDKAFQQLQSFTYKGSFVSLDPMQVNLHPPSLPSLTSLDLSACRSDLFHSTRQLWFDCFCHQLSNSNLQTFRIHLRAQVKLDLSWCGSKALRKMKHLQTIAITSSDQQVSWNIDARVLMDIHSLMDLSELSYVEILSVCIQSRVELSEIMTLKEISMPSIQRSLANATSL